MVWFKVDDALSMHMKAFTAGNQALGLWVRAGSWCMQQLTDGLVPDGVVLALGGSAQDASALVDAGLWHPAEGGFQFHDWAEYQPTREQVLAERMKTRERVEKHRASKARNAEGNGVTNGGGTHAPSRPVPTPDLTKTSMSQSSNNRAKDSTDSVVIHRDMEQRASMLYGITSIQAIITQIEKHTGRVVNPEQALQVSNWILGKAKNDPKVPQRYVFGAISRSPFEVQKHIDEAVL